MIKILRYHDNSTYYIISKFLRNHKKKSGIDCQGKLMSGSLEPKKKKVYILSLGQGRVLKNEGLLVS